MQKCETSVCLDTYIAPHELSMSQIPSVKKNLFIFLIDSLALLFLFFMSDQLYFDGVTGCFGLKYARESS